MWDNKVQAIQVRMLSGLPQTLGQTISRYGEPENVEIAPFFRENDQTAYGGAVVYYPKIGAAFTLNVEPPLQPDSKIDATSLFPPGSIDATRATMNEHGGLPQLFRNRLQKWLGFGDYNG